MVIQTASEAHRHSTAVQHDVDAQFILETIMHRNHWTVETRDQISAALTIVAEGKPLKKHKPGQINRTNR